MKTKPQKTDRRFVAVTTARQTHVYIYDHGHEAAAAAVVRRHLADVAYPLGPLTASTLSARLALSAGGFNQSYTGQA